MTSNESVPESQHNLRCSIPPGRHVLGKVRRVFIWPRFEASAQAKVANLEFTVRVDEQIAWLEVTMDDGCRMDVFHS